MEDHFAQSLRVVDGDACAVGRFDGADVRDLAARLGVERRVLNNERHAIARRCFVCLDELRAIETEQPAAGRGVEFGVVVAVERGGGQRVLLHDIGERGRGRHLARPTARQFACLLHEPIEPRGVDRHAAFLRHHLREVEREAEGVVQLECIFGADGVVLCRGAGVLEKRNPAIDRARKARFLLADGFGDFLRVLPQFRERIAHGIDNGGHELVQERLVHVHRLPAVTHRAAKDAAEHVATPLVAGHRPIRQRERQTADVVGDDAIRHVRRIVEAAAVRLGASHLGDRLEHRREHIGVVVGINVLQHGTDALEPHARVHVPGGQRRQLARRVTVELHEHQVPDLHHPGIVGVDQACAGLVGGAVDVDLAARTARPRVAHFPEVVLLRAEVDVRRVDVGDGAPQFGGFVVGFQTVSLVPAEDGGVQPALVDAPDVGEQIPRPGDGLGLEVVAERPVAQHLEEGVVVGVLADIFQVVVFAAGADALLAVDGTGVVAGAGGEEDVFELVHAGVREQQRRVAVRHDGAGRHERMSVFFHEIVDELLTDCCAGEHDISAAFTQGWQDRVV